MKQQNVASIMTEAPLLVSPVCQLHSNWMPSIEAVAIINKAVDLFSIPENYVKACKYLIESGFRIDLDWRDSYRKEWDPKQPTLYKIGFHKPTEYDGKIQYTPFPLREQPIKEYENSYVVKIMFRGEYEFGNAMRALHAYRNYGIVVMKKKRTPEDLAKEKERKQRQINREIMAVIEHQVKKKAHKDGRHVSLSEEVKISTFKQNTK